MRLTVCFVRCVGAGQGGPGSGQERPWSSVGLTLRSARPHSGPWRLRFWGGWYWAHWVRVTGEPSDQNTAWDVSVFRPIHTLGLGPETVTHTRTHARTHAHAHKNIHTHTHTCTDTLLEIVV